MLRSWVAGCLSWKNWDPLGQIGISSGRRLRTWSFCDNLPPSCLLGLMVNFNFQRVKAKFKKKSLKNLERECSIVVSIRRVESSGFCSSYWLMFVPVAWRDWWLDESLSYRALLSGFRSVRASPLFSIHEILEFWRHCSTLSSPLRKRPMPVAINRPVAMVWSPRL